MANGWQRVGRLIAVQREIAGFKTQLALANAVRVSDTTIGLVERGVRNGGHSETLFYDIELAIGWTRGSIRRTAEGGRPALVPDPQLARVELLWRRLDEQGKRGVIAFIENMLD